MISDTVTVASCSFLRFVYPFTFSPDTYEQLVKALDSESELWTQEGFKIDEMLAHAADYLHRTCGHARIWTLTDKDSTPVPLSRYLGYQLLADNRIIPFSLGRPHDDSAAVELTLFEIGVGFLTISAQPQSAKLDDWLAFLHYFRVMSGNHDPCFSITSPAKEDAVGVLDQGTVNMCKKRNDLLCTVLQPNKGGENWWQDVFVPNRMIPFAAIFADGLNDEHAGAEILYRVRHFFRTDQNIIADEQDLQRENNPALISFAKGQQFAFSLESGLFIAFNSPEDDHFFRGKLPLDLYRGYFLVFLLAQHQRFALMRLSQLVAERWRSGGTKQAERFDRIRKELLAFTALAYFVQIMQREHHDRYYRKWHEVFQTDRLYQEVRDEVRELHEYLQAEQYEAQAKVTTWFVAALTFNCAVFGFLGINIKGFTIPGLSIAHAGMLLGATAVINAVLLVPAILRYVRKTQQYGTRKQKISRV